jgi:hypothetical protein
MKIDIDFTKYSVEELRELQNEIGNYLYNMNDGFIYICRVRSYGRNWVRTLTNEVSVNDLCLEYDGYDGIVDVYTTNPDANIENYGEVKYIKSVEDYEKWKQSNILMDLIKSTEKELKEWEDRDNVSFHSRPMFAPIWTDENIIEWRNELESLECTYEEPVSIKKYEDYE